MAYDYSDDVAFAQEMIAEFGRQIVLVKYSGIPGDANKPLHGPTAPPTRVEDIFAAFLEPSSVIRLGQSTEQRPGLWKDSTQIALIAADGANDFATFHAIEDSDGSGWKIEHVETLKPGATAVLYFVGVKR